jgi:hypothetical protein
MFSQTTQPYSSANQYPAGQQDKNLARALRILWASHLVYEQAQFNKKDASRHPLTLDLQARNFFGQK